MQARHQTADREIRNEVAGADSCSRDWRDLIMSCKPLLDHAALIGVAVRSEHRIRHDLPQQIEDLMCIYAEFWKKYNASPTASSHLARRVKRQC
jgi:hypothetical protein